MKRRKTKHWSYIHCAHAKVFFNGNYYEAHCKQRGCECMYEECKHILVSNYIKRAVRYENKMYRRHK